MRFERTGSASNAVGLVCNLWSALRNQRNKQNPFTELKALNIINKQ